MAEKKVLTDAEKAKVRDHVLKQERDKHPESSVTVIVGDEVGEDGIVPVQIVVQTTTILPRG